jgi:hypothetical protein
LQGVRVLISASDQWQLQASAVPVEAIINWVQRCNVSDRSVELAPDNRCSSSDLLSNQKIRATRSLLVHKVVTGRDFNFIE